MLQKTTVEPQLQLSDARLSGLYLVQRFSRWRCSGATGEGKKHRNGAEIRQLEGGVQKGFSSLHLESLPLRSLHQSPSALWRASNQFVQFGSVW